MKRLTIGLLAGSLLLVGCSDEPEAENEAVAQQKVEIDVEAPTKDPIKLGVLVTLSDQPGQGADALPGSEGAQVAVYRLEKAGQPVELTVVDDSGTAGGARKAMRQLVDAGVSGVVAATTGGHVIPALQVADEAQTPVLLPYVRTRRDLPEGSWLTGPSPAGVDAAVQGVLKRRSLTKPFLISADKVLAPDVAAVRQSGFTVLGEDRVVDEVRAAARQGAIDSVVMAGSARAQATVARRLQGLDETLPVIFTPEALSQVFADELAVEGVLADEFVAVGFDATDATTTASTDRADDAASFFAALRLLDRQPDTQDLFGSVPFADVAAGADIASHDAVVALVSAVTAAGSSAPADVRGALTSLQVDGEDGVAGPPLDFANQQAAADSEVVELVSTDQDPGVRPGVGPNTIYWFALPAA